MSLTANQETAVKLIEGYINVVKKCAENPGMRKRWLEHPEDEATQQEIHKELIANGFLIPQDAFVAFDAFSMTSKIFICHKDTNNQIIVFEQNELVETITNSQDFDKAQPGGTKVQIKHELEIIKINVEEVLAKYRICIVLPFLIFSAAQVNFAGKEEVLLSTC